METYKKINRLGVLKCVPFHRVERIVIAKLAENDGKWSEVLLVSDTEGDYAPLLSGFGSIDRISSDSVDDYVKCLFPKLPVSHITISHVKKTMTQHYANRLIMGDNPFVISHKMRMKRTLQFHYHDASTRMKKEAEKEFMDKYKEKLWDGTEAIFKDV